MQPMRISVSKAGKDFTATFILVVIYAGVFYGFQFFFCKSLLFTYIPDIDNINKWDVSWYKTIADTGYRYIPGESNNLALYFFFPLVWKITHLGIIGMSCLNVVFFATGFSILCGLYPVTITNKILWLTIPPVYFAFIPYSEALFFLLSSILVLGITKNNRRIIWTSLFLLSLTRATYTFLGPAFVVMCLVSANRKYWYKSLYYCFITYLLPMILGTALFIWYQYLQTGIWFVFFEVAKKSWGHAFNIPVLPFSSLASTLTLWIGALAMFAGLLSFFYLAWKFCIWLFRNNNPDPLLMASCTYLFMASLVVVFFNPTWGANTTNVSGIFRYVFVNPFFYIFLFHFTSRLKYGWKNYVFVIILANILWLAFGSLQNLDTFLYFTFNTALLVLLMLGSDKKISWPVMLVAAINFFIQLQFLQLYIGQKYFPD